MSPPSQLSPGALRTRLYHFSKKILFFVYFPAIPSLSRFCFESQRQTWTWWREKPASFSVPQKILPTSLLSCQPCSESLGGSSKAGLWETEIERKQREVVNKNRETGRVTKKEKKMGKKSKKLKLIYILAPEANSVFIRSPRPARANSVLK